MKKVLLFAVVLATTSLFAADGAALTKTCVACHGVNFTKPPQGNTHHIIKDSKARIVKMIKYYQHPKEADEMVMKAPVENLTDAQINTIADWIVQGTPSSSKEAVKLTQTCAKCHGAHFTKAPEGNEHHIVRDSKERIVKMIKYYQHPEEDDEMVMKAPVEKLTDAQINTVAEYIFNHHSKK